MDRRQYLGLACAAALAGCSDDTDASNGDGGSQTTTDPAAQTAETTTAEPTAAETETTSTEAEFEIVAVDAPNRVEVEEAHSIGIDVKNVGRASGDFQATLQVSTAESSQWEDVTQIAIEDIAPGETKTWESETLSFDQPRDVRLRLEGYETVAEYEVISPEADVVFGDSRLVEVDVDGATHRMAEVEVVNRGSSPAGRVPVTIDWYDESESYLASSETSIPALAGQTTWIPRVDPKYDISDASEIAGFEPNLGQIKAAPTLDPDGITLVSDELLASEQEVIVRGEVENERESAINYLQIVANVHNADGAIIGSSSANELNVPAGERFRFELQFDTAGRNGAVESHSVIVSDDFSP